MPAEHHRNTRSFVEVLLIPNSTLLVPLIGKRSPLSIRFCTACEHVRAFAITSSPVFVLKQHLAFVPSRTLENVLEACILIVGSSDPQMHVSLPSTSGSFLVHTCAVGSRRLCVVACNSPPVDEEYLTHVRGKRFHCTQCGKCCTVRTLRWCSCRCLFQLICTRFPKHRCTIIRDQGRSG